MRYVQCVEALSVLHMEEKMILTDTRTPESMKVYVDAAQRQRKLTDFGASWATENLNQKVVKAELLFSGFLVKPRSCES